MPFFSSQSFILNAPRRDAWVCTHKEKKIRTYKIEQRLHTEHSHKFTEFKASLKTFV